MLSTLANGLSQGFLGSAVVKANPVYVTDGIWKIPGIIADNAQTAYFGRVVSSNEATMQDFLMGAQGAVFVGVLINEAGVNQNEPFKNNYRLYTEPATAVRRGWVFLNSWTHAASGALTTPTRGCVPIYDTTTGNIEFLASTAVSIPSGWAMLPASVELVDTANQGVLLWLNPEADASVDAMFQRFIDYTTATGTYRNIIAESKLTNAAITTASLYTIRGAAILSGTSTGASYMAGVQGKLTITGTWNDAVGDSRFAAMIAQLDTSTATITAAGQLSCLWVDAGATASATMISTKGGGQWNLIRITNTTAANANAVIYAYAEADYLMELGGPSGNADWFDAGTGASASVSGHLKIKLNGTAAYIRVYASAS